MLQRELNKVWKNWRVDKLLGEGSFGKVYRIEKEEFGHTYEAALKVIQIPQSDAEVASIRNDGMDEESVTEYFQSIVEDIINEFVLMSKLKGNTNIVSYEDHVVIPNEDKIGWTIYIRMELLTPLFDYLKEKPLSVRDVIRLGIDTCNALELCQTYNIIHRDIKPENIFVNNFGNFKLGDFGIARQLEKTSSGLSKKGTYSYMAPEVYKGEEYNSTVDVYSLGIVLYRFLNNNRTPFLPEYPAAIRYADKERANVLRISGAKIPKPCMAEGRLAEIILKACAYDPKERYESASDMKRALEGVLYEETLADVAYPHGDRISNERFDYSASQSETELLSESDRTTVLLGDDDSTRYLYRETTKPQERAQVIQKKSKKGLVAAIVVVVISVIIAGTVAGIKMYQKAQEREVPNVLHMTVEEASKLTELKVKELGEEYSDSVEKGDIISQSLEAGSIVNKDEEIAVIVSKGALVEVPSLKGKTAEEAEKLLTEVGLVYDVSKSVYSDRVKKGNIISQGTQAGAKVEEGSTVAVEVSKGVEQVEVPDVVGKSKENAKKALEKAGLKYETSSSYSSSVENGDVISQSVKAGKKVDKDTKVELVISKGPKPVAKPTYTPPSRGSGSSNNNSSSGGSTENIDEWEVIN